MLGMSLPPCRRYHPAGVVRRFSQSAAPHAAFTLRLRARPLGLLTVEAISAFTFVTARRLTVHPIDGVVDRLQRFSFLPLCYPSYEVSDICLGGFSFPTEHASLRWTHNRT